MYAPISKPTVQSFLFDQGIDLAKCPVLLPDDLYALPAVDWLANEFAEAFVHWRDDLVGLYAKGSSDCDDFAECAAFFAHYLHRRTPNHPKGSALAFGEFWYCIGGRPDRGHAINCAIAHEDLILRIVFFEPQTAELITLTHEEISSCVSIKF